MEKIKEETIKKLEELKENLGYDNEENYCNMINILIDYDNEAQDNLYLYDRVSELVEFVTEDTLAYYLEYQFKTFGVERLFYITQCLEHSDTIYKINGYGNLENVDDDDFIWCIDDAIDALKEGDEEDETTNN